MTSPVFTNAVSAADVRGYLELNTVASASKYSDGAIGSNIRAAGSFLERATGRWFADRTAVTWTGTSQGRTAVTIPGFRTVTSAVQQSVALTADQSYYLIPDVQQSGIYTAIQLRGFGSRSGTYGYLGNPQWFDRNLDMTWGRDDWSYSLPNDVVLNGDGGYTDANLPEAFRHALKVLAAWYTKRPDSLLADVAITPEGNVLNYASLPPEVGEFIALWKLTADQAVSVG